jgi:chemotaxis protein histidine kinase CheA
MADNTTTYNTVVDVQVKGEGSLDNLNQTVDDTGQGFVRLQRQIKETNIELQRAASSGDKVKFNQLKKQLDDLEEGLEKVQFKSKQFDDQLSALPGPAGQAGQAIKSIDGAFKLLAANPIIAIIGAAIGIFLLLKKSLESTAEGQAVLNRISTAFSKILGPIMALIESVAVPLFEKLAGILEAVGSAFAFVDEKLGISKKKIDEASSGVKDFAAENKKAAEESKKQAKEDSERRKKEAEDRKKKAEERAKQLAEEKQRAIDNAKKAIDLAEAIKESEDKLAQARTKIYGDKIAQMKQEQDFADLNYQREKKRIEDLMKINNLSEEDRKRLLSERNNLEAQYVTDTRSREQAIADEQKARDEEAKKKVEEDAQILADKQSQERADKIALIDAEFQYKIATGELTFQDELNSFDRTAALQRQELEANKASADALLAFDKQTAAARIQIEEAQAQAKMSVISNALGAVADMVGRNTVAGKLLSVAQATMDTYAGANRALKEYPPPFSFIAAGTVIAAGLMNVKKILSTKIPPIPKPGGGSTTPSGGGSVPSAPSLPTMNAPMVNVGGGANPTQQIADTLAASTQKPIKAYVVSGDVSSQQALDRRTSRAATFSGG